MMLYYWATKTISIHTPHAGSDWKTLLTFWNAIRFQSTLPMRGATRILTGILLLQSFQSTLPMRGATIALVGGIIDVGISIHTPHAGSDFL